MGENIGSFDLPTGQRAVIRNPQAASMRFEMETSAGTVIAFPVAPFGEFEITAGPDIVKADFVVLKMHELGPRAVDDNGNDA